MVADPAVTPVTRPVVLTVATAPALVAQVTTGSGVQFEEFTDALSCTEAPLTIVGALGATAIADTLHSTSVGLLRSQAVVKARPRAEAARAKGRRFRAGDLRSRVSGETRSLRWSGIFVAP